MTETTRTLGAERERLDAAVDEVADLLAAADADANTEALRRQATDLDEQGRAVAALVDEYGAEATVTVRGLTAGEYARVEDRIAAMQTEAGSDRTPGSSRNVFAAAGLVDAPFYDGPADDLDAALACVAAQPVGVVKWLEALVNDQTTVDEGNWTPLRERLAGRSGA